MLVHGTAGQHHKIPAILVVLLVATALSAQTMHVHSSAETVELDESQVCIRSPEGSNLSVRPPPIPFS